MLLLVNVEFWPLALKLVMSLFGIISISALFEGWLLTDVQMYERILLFIAAIGMFFINSGVLHFLGLILFLMVLSSQWYRKTKLAKDMAAVQ